jgi:hypothetical protein
MLRTKPNKYSPRIAKAHSAKINNMTEAGITISVPGTSPTRNRRSRAGPESKLARIIRPDPALKRSGALFVICDTQLNLILI